jgi:hypothetical protein
MVWAFPSWGDGRGVLTATSPWSPSASLRRAQCKASRPLPLRGTRPKGAPQGCFAKGVTAALLFSVYTWGMTTDSQIKSIECEKSMVALYGWLGWSLINHFWILNWALTGPRTHWGEFSKVKED